MSKIIVKPYQDDIAEEWDKFVWASRNGTIFHTRRFLSYHPKDRFEDQSLAIYRKNKLFAVFPAATKKENGVMTLSSHPGASYGGPIINDYAGLKHVYNLLGEIEEYASNTGYKAIEMRLPPRIYHKSPCEEIDFALKHRNYQLQSVELTSSIPLTNIKHKKSKYRDDTRRSVKKALDTNLEFKQTDDLDTYWDILTENLKKHDTTPTHSLKEIKHLKRLFPDKIRLFGAYKADELVAGILIFICNNKAFHTFYIAQNYDYQKLRPLNGILHKLIEWGIEKDYKYLNLGISTEKDGEIINWGLFRFKEGFGARGILRKYYKLELS